VIIPSENEKDLADIPDNVKKGLEIVPVANMEEVLKIALVRLPRPWCGRNPTSRLLHGSPTTALKMLW
jgi:ATP-dependent Lon protease